MPQVNQRRTGVAIALFFSAGLLLRWYFVQWHPFVAGDSGIYLDISQTWLDSHIYGLSTNAAPRPTMIRLPGYPMVLALLQWLVPASTRAPDGSGVFHLVEWFQIFTDLTACGLLASVAYRRFGKRAGMAALAMSTLCPFLANYTAVPLTESLVIGCSVLAWWAADLWRAKRTWWSLLLTGLALGYSILLRPDQGLLSAAVLVMLLWPARGTTRLEWRPALLCAALVVAALVPWTLRNLRTFHTFQPLAPKSATDPGEPYPQGFPRWYRTFGIDFASTEDAYWNYPEIAVDPGDLPSRAFGSAAERQRVTALLAQTAEKGKLQPAIEAQFQSLAAERIRAQPFRYYVTLPVARLINMLFHPRTEMLPIDERWWRFSLHPWQTSFATVYGLLNLGYMVLALLGLPRAWRLDPALAASLALFFLLRCALLLTLDNAEQRYTLEFSPAYFLLGAAWFKPRIFQT